MFECTPNQKKAIIYLINRLNIKKGAGREHWGHSKRRFCYLYCNRHYGFYTVTDTLRVADFYREELDYLVTSTIKISFSELIELFIRGFRRY